VIDAFDAPVFCATPDHPVPGSGETISLESPTLRPGCDEYVIGPVEAAKIEILPLRRRRFEDGVGLEVGAALWRRLISY
jgi:hypothetical protein